MNNNTISQIERLHILKQQGAISEAEFERQKTTLLSNQQPLTVVVQNKTRGARVLGIILAILFGGFVFYKLYEALQVF